MGIYKTQSAIAGGKKHIGHVVVSTVEPYLFLDKCKESSELGRSTALIGVLVARPQWVCSYVVVR